MIKRIVQTGLLFLFVMYLCCTADITKRAYVSAPEPKIVVSSEQELHGKLADGFYKYVRGLYDYVDVTRRQMGEETFFEIVYSRLDDFKRQYPDKKILCSVDVESPLDGVVEVEIEGEFTHYLYVAMGGAIYEFQGKMMSSLVWDEYLRMLVNDVEQKGDGSWLSRRIWDYNKNFSDSRDAVTTVILWQNIEMSLSENERLISVAGTIGHTDPRGFSLCYQERDTEGNERMHEVSIHHTMALEGYETEEQASAYLLERYPDAERCEVYLALNEEGSIFKDDNLYVVVEKNAVHGYFTSWSRAYVIEERLDYDRDMEEDAQWMGAVRYVLEQLDYDDSADCVWQKQETEQGTFWADYEAGRFYMEQDVGTGERFRFFAKRVEVPPEEDFPERVYREVQMTIFREAEQEPFQEFTVYSGETYRKYPFLMFEDFNMDGFLDLKVIGFTAASNESADHYVWSPSAGCFTESLSTFGRYGISVSERKLCERVHGSASSGSLYLYQWENEADYELIKYMDYDFDDTGAVTEIGRYVDGEKETLVSYPEDRPYTGENGLNPAGLFWDDLVWEMSITDKVDGKSYRIYYAQEFQYDEDGEKTGRIEGHLYVVDDTLALYNYLEWEEGTGTEYTEILWDDTDGEETLVIRYRDNRLKVWSVTELLQKDS